MCKFLSVLVVGFSLVMTGRGHAEIQNHFAPGNDCQDAILQHIESAERQIDISLYVFTVAEMSQALQKAHQRGVKVRLMTDKGGFKTRYSTVSQLAKAGIEVRIFNRAAKMHNKFAIFDHNTVLNGSYNWTVVAKRNAETCSFISDEPQNTADFQTQFDYLWNSLCVDLASVNGEL